MGNEILFLIIGLVVGAGALYLYVDYSGGVLPQTGYYNSQTNYYQNETTTDQTQQQAASRPDLTQVFLPYLAVTDPVTSCSAHNGQWFQGPTKVGCFTMGIPINVTSTCNTALYLAAVQQCTAVGGISVCDASNVGCFYN